MATKTKIHELVESSNAMIEFKVAKDELIAVQTLMEQTDLYHPDADTQALMKNSLAQHIYEIICKKKKAIKNAGSFRWYAYQAAWLYMYCNDAEWNIREDAPYLAAQLRTLVHRLDKAMKSVKVNEYVRLH